MVVEPHTPPSHTGTSTGIEPERKGVKICMVNRPGLICLVRSQPREAAPTMCSEDQALSRQTREKILEHAKHCPQNSLNRVGEPHPLL